MKTFVNILVAAGALLTALVPARGQWLTQSVDLQPGWNAVYLHVDASYATLQDLVAADAGNPIQEVWLWTPSPSALQFIDTPQLPTGSGTPWASWIRSLGPSSTLSKVMGNAAYLVKVGGTAVYRWNLKGKPVAPHYSWTTTGLNLLGFPTLATNAPSFEAFLSQAPDLQQNAQVFGYVGGDLGPGNPIRLYAFRTTPVTRGTAFWIRSGTSFNRYFGPIALDLQTLDGVNYGDGLGQYRIRLRNVAASSLTVSLELVVSETVPAGQTAIVGTPPLLLRGRLDPTTLTYGYAALTAGPQQWTLSAIGQVGSEVELVLGVNRSQMPGSAGALYAGVLRFKDSLGLAQVDVPVTATVSSRAGLWIGEASVAQVRHYLKNYEKDSGGATAVSDSGSYTVTGVNTNMGPVARPYPLRLILHNDAAGRVVLLQRAYYGLSPSANLVVATQEGLLDPDQLNTARRVSVVHLPWSTANTPWAFTGALTPGTSLTTSVTLDYNDSASNPFVHSYHPDHDNLSATFDQVLPQGAESYGLSRAITLSLTAPHDDFASLTSSSQNLVGVYQETVTLNGQGAASRSFDVLGSFYLNRISDLGTLTTP